MLVGQPPFTGATAQAVMARHALEPVPSIRMVRSTVPPALEAAIVKAAAKVPADRFATAGALGKALSAEAATEITSAGAAAGGPSQSRAMVVGGGRHRSQSSRPRPASWCYADAVPGPALRFGPGGVAVLACDQR